MGVTLSPLPFGPSDAAICSMATDGMNVVALEQIPGDATIAAESAMGAKFSKCQAATAVGAVEPRLSAPLENIGGKADNSQLMPVHPPRKHGDGVGEGITEFCYGNADHSKLSGAVAALVMYVDPSSPEVGRSAPAPPSVLEVRLNGEVLWAVAFYSVLCRLLLVWSHCRTPTETWFVFQAPARASAHAPALEPVEDHGRDGRECRKSPISEASSCAPSEIEDIRSGSNLKGHVEPIADEHGMLLLKLLA